MENVTAKKQGLIFRLVKAYYDFKEIREEVKLTKELEKQRLAQADADYRTLINSVAYHGKYSSLLQEYNALVDMINKKGGRQFLDHAVIAPPPQFTQEEIRILIQLCHPDKHNGKESAANITKKLLALRQ